MERISLSVKLNQDLYNDAEMIADKAGLSVEGLIKILLKGVSNLGEIPDQMLYNKQTYDDYIEEQVTKSLNGKKISSDEANKILGFDPTTIIN